MRVEEGIGRTDRLGQRHATVRIVKLHFGDTGETAVYRAQCQPIGLLESVVGGP